jgi:hypothetical protein
MLLQIGAVGVFKGLGAAGDGVVLEGGGGFFFFDFLNGLRFVCHVISPFFYLIVRRIGEMICKDREQGSEGIRD